MSDIVDQIYEAGAVPELWPDLLHTLGQVSEAKGAVLFSLRGEDSRWVASEPFRHFIEDYFAGGHQHRDERTPRLLAKQHAGFLTELDIFDSAAAWSGTSMLKEFLVPQGLGWGIATAIHVPSGDTLILHAERAFTDGPIPRSIVAALDGLRPHLARAALMSARLGFERARGMAEALSAIGLAGAVVDGKGRALACNELFTGMIPKIFLDLPSRLAIADQPSDLLLQHALEALGTRHGHAVPSSIAIPAREDRPATIVHVVPISGAAHDVFVSAQAILIVTPVEINKVPTANVIQGLFDLTAAEARVAGRVGEGKTIAEIAAESGRSVETIRTQLRMVFEKIGVHRQTELVALLQGTPMWRAAGHEDPG
jgi:DNA-binding CsgD family transcriptional regulator